MLMKIHFFSLDFHQVVLNYVRRPELEGQTSMLDVDTGTSQYDLEVVVDDTGSHMTVAIDYRIENFELARIQVRNPRVNGKEKKKKEKK